MAYQVIPENQHTAIHPCKICIRSFAYNADPFVEQYDSYMNVNGIPCALCNRPINTQDPYLARYPRLGNYIVKAFKAFYALAAEFYVFNEDESNIPLQNAKWKLEEAAYLYFDVRRKDEAVTESERYLADITWAQQNGQTEALEAVYYNSIERLWYGKDFLKDIAGDLEPRREAASAAKAMADQEEARLFSIHHSKRYRLSIRNL
ncbi:hypothetical protein V8C37DRAFT_392433 [Trichoderma ceciliae]